VAEDKEKVVQASIAELEKQFDKGVVFKGSDAPLKVDAIPTGSIALDKALGIGGIPRGRITVITGRESAGKTSLVKHIIAEAQAMGEMCAFIDAEHSFDRPYAESIGVNVADLLISQPDYGEQAIDVAEGLIRSGGIGVVVIDSVAALVTQAEVEGDMTDQQMGALARLMSKAFKKLGGPVLKTKTALLLTDQLREKIGGFSPTGQAPEVMPGGRAMKYYPSVILDMRRVEDLKEGKELIGIRTRVKVSKSKVAPPFKEAMLDIYYGQGICKVSGMLDVAVDMNIVKRTGAWYTYQDQKWQGKDAAKLFLKNNPELLAEIEREIRSAD
jgi:recombination protein RecA